MGGPVADAAREAGQALASCPRLRENFFDTNQAPLISRGRNG